MKSISGRRFSFHDLLAPALVALTGVGLAAWSPFKVAYAGTGPAHDVVGGDAALECAFPSLVLLSTGGGSFCTGTLVHPQVIAYAAHCGDSVIGLFGEGTTGPRVGEVELAMVNPDYSSVQDEAIDWAFARLKEPVEGVPVIPLAAGCELDQLAAVGNPIVMVGYSNNETSSPPGLNWAADVVTEVSSTGWIQVGGNGSGKHPCPGDSGGPLLAQLPDGSWRSLGMNSTLYNLCSDPDPFSRYAAARPDMIAWIESSSGIDITPCYAPDGTFEGGSTCKSSVAYAGDPEAPVGTWDDLCKGAPSVTQHKACGGDSTEEDSSTSTQESTGDSDTTSDSTETSDPSSSTDDPSASDSSVATSTDGEDSQSTDCETCSTSVAGSDDSSELTESTSTSTGDADSSETSSDDKTNEGGQGGCVLAVTGHASQWLSWGFAFVFAAAGLRRARRRR